MTDDTRNCDDVAAYLGGLLPPTEGGRAVIHTKANGEISEGRLGQKQR
jgi:type III restriction enzyme